MKIEEFDAGLLPDPRFRALANEAGALLGLLRFILGVRACVGLQGRIGHVRS